MSRYIDAEELREAVKQWDMQDLYLPVHFLDLIEDIPTADVVEVIRCKDCIFSRELDDYEKRIFLENCVGCVKHSKSYSTIVMQDNDFCSYGERKNGGNDK